MAGQGSARVSLREIDLSAPTPVNRVLTGTPAGVVGRAKRGPAFVPTVFADIQEFQDIFGSFSDKGLDSNSNLFGPLAVSEWMSGNPGQGAFVRLLGVGSEPGFIVGTKQLGTDGNLISNSNAVNTATDNSAIDVKGKSFILGHFVKDATNSKYLTEANLQLQNFETANITVVDQSLIVVNDDFSITPIGTNETARQFTFKSTVTNSASQILIPTAAINLLTSISTNFTQLGVKKTALQTAINNLADEDAPIGPVEAAFTTLQTEYTSLVTNKNSLIANSTIKLDTVQRVIGSDLDVIASLITSLQTNLTAISTSITALGAADLITFAAARTATTALITTFTDLIDDDNADVVFKFNALRDNKLTNNFLQACEIKKSIDTAFSDYKITATVDGAIIKLVQLVSTLTASEIDVDITNMTANTLTIATGDANVSTAIPLMRGLLMTPHNVKASLSSAIANKETAPTTQSVKDDIGYEIGNLNNGDFTLFLTGYTGQNKSITCSFDSTKSNYFYKVLNTDPHKIEELGHYLHSYYDINSSVITSSVDGILNSSNEAVTIATAGAFCVANQTRSFEEFDDKFQTAVSPWIVSQDFGIKADGSDNDGMGDGILKLFRFHALDDGDIGNRQVKVLVSNLTQGEFGGFGTFDITLQRWDSNPLKNSVLASWKRLSLDASASNYIARVIGDKKVYWDFEATKPGLQEEGSYPVTNKFVRVEVSGEVAIGDVPAETIPCGFAGIKKLHLKNKFSDKSKVLNAQHLNNLQQPPVPMIRSIGKIIQGAADEKDAKIIPWGVKFALKENVDVTIDGFKEYIEQTFNKSLISYTRYFKNNWSAVIVDGSLTEELDYANDPNFFHLEKIRITKKTDGKVDNKKWGDAIFVRDSVVANDTVPTGASRRFFRATRDLSLANNKYLSFSCFMQGGFDGLDIFDEDKHYLKDAACYKEGQKTSKTGPVIETYQQGIDVYTDKAAAEIQLLTVPGIRERLVTNYAVQAAETRFDTMYIMDIEQKNADGEFIINATDKPSVGQTIDEFSGRGMDTSFAASFFPDVMLNKPNGGSIKVPPSIAALGVMSRADNGGNAPWYAPAGINRGLVNASAAEFAISREQLDELYDNDINPIYIPAGRDQVHVFGQKTLLKNPSALDRINVRRLLIYVRRRVKQIANTFLFQPNRADTLKAFANAVEPILANIQAQQGIERYKVQIDTTTTTQSDVENNTIRGKIYLQPTKSIEFISLDFEVRNSID
jgi:hypothetical protein